jgi:ubiquinone/menaquinone biosynthesis C-methylase UbiE
VPWKLYKIYMATEDPRNMQTAGNPSPAELYEQLYVPAIFAEMARALVERAAPRSGEHALDLACGTGIVARSVAPLVNETGRVVAVDLRPGMLAVGRAAPAPDGAAIEWMEGDAVALNLPDAAFDLVLCQHGLQFFADRGASLAQMRRVLRDTGRVAVAVWRSLEEHPLFEALADAELRHLGGLGVTREEANAPFALGDADELRGLLEQAGFRQIEIAKHTVTARFRSAATFVRDIEYPYSAFMPQFAEDPDAFAAFVSAVESDTRDVVERYRIGDEVRAPMHAHVVVAPA